MNKMNNILIIGHNDVFILTLNFTFNFITNFFFSTIV